MDEIKFEKYKNFETSFLSDISKPDVIAPFAAAQSECPDSPYIPAVEPMKTRDPVPVLDASRRKPRAVFTATPRLDDIVLFHL